MWVSSKSKFLRILCLNGFILPLTSFWVQWVLYVNGISLHFYYYFWIKKYKTGSTFWSADLRFHTIRYFTLVEYHMQRNKAFHVLLASMIRPNTQSLFFILWAGRKETFSIARFCSHKKKCFHEVFTITFAFFSIYKWVFPEL